MAVLMYDDYIYLHFLDRELRNSIGEGLKFNDNSAEIAIYLALLMTALPLYVSFSHMYESLSDFPNSIHMLFELEKLGLCKMLTNARNLEEFLASRRLLYDFDKERYHNYFSANGVFWPLNTHILTTDTTSILRSKILNKLLGNEHFISEKLQNDIAQLLFINKKDAITFSLFREPIQSAYNKLTIDDYAYHSTSTTIRQMISAQYSSRYLDELNGTIITGLSGISIYDFLAKNQFQTNFLLYDALISPFIRDLESRTPVSMDCVLELRFSHEFPIIRQLIVLILRALEQISNGDVHRAKAFIVRFNSQFMVRNKRPELFPYCIALYNHLIFHYSIEDNVMSPKILLIVATQLELQVFLETFQTYGAVVPLVGKLSYFTSIINNSSVYIVKSQMGQGGVGGSILTLEESIRLIKPNLVIMGGIAWGANTEHQNVGDLLVSTQIWDYDLERINSDGTELFRGAVFPSSPQVVQMFEVACASKTEYNINYGLIASGSILFDNIDYINKLKRIKPELIGGDMESAGMASACSRNQIPWIMAKGICDWGYNKDSHKKEYQQIAARNSADAIVSLLSQLSY